VVLQGYLDAVGATKEESQFEHLYQALDLSHGGPLYYLSLFIYYIFHYGLLLYVKFGIITFWFMIYIVISTSGLF
jgi:hypothetical protein